MKYSYEGDPFVSAESPFTTSDRVEGWFVIDCSGLSLDAACATLDFNDYTPNVVSFAFTAGPLSITEASPGISIQFAFQTGIDTASSMSNWQLFIIDSTGSIHTESCSTEPPWCPGLANGDSAFSFAHLPMQPAVNRLPGDLSQPGVWSVVSVPVPPFLHLFAAALAFFASAAWRWRARVRAVAVEGRAFESRLATSTFAR